MLSYEGINTDSYITKSQWSQMKKNAEVVLEKINSGDPAYAQALGWFVLDDYADNAILDRLEKKAAEIRENADVFVLIGVGGSNQAARAVIKALQPESDKTKIIYAGNNLSASYMNRLLRKLDGKSVHVHVIAKNFATLEPGLAFRILRKYMIKRYGEQANKRITVTGSLDGDCLRSFASERGYEFFEFPERIGGRYSALSAVGLLPMAVAGINIHEMVKGARDIEFFLNNTPPEQNPAVLYSATRNCLYQNDYYIEMLSFFDWELDYFAKWWIQLFAESEGKEHQGIFPVSSSFTEDLHSMGQYIQDGKRSIIETFLVVDNANGSLVVDTEEQNKDNFNYLDGKDMTEINKIARDATLSAHANGGVPCMSIRIPALTPYYFGQLFYFFAYSCYISSELLGINAFNQPGVEAYKAEMFRVLGASL